MHVKYRIREFIGQNPQKKRFEISFKTHQIQKITRTFRHCRFDHSTRKIHRNFMIKMSHLEHMWVFVII